MTRLDRRADGWAIYMLGVMGIALVVASIGDPAINQAMLTTMGIAAGVAVVVGIRANRPAHPQPWWLMAGCLFVATLGTAIATVASSAAGIGQAMTAVGDLAGITAFGMLIRGSIPGGDRAALLDAAILASGIGILVWSFGLAPVLVKTGNDAVLQEALFFAAIVALSMVGRLWFLPGAHRPATRLMIAFVVASTVVTCLELLRDVLGPAAYGFGHTLTGAATLALVGAAALHPTMARPPTLGSADPGTVSRRRLAALTMALLINPITLAIQTGTGGTVDAVPYVIGGVLIGVLVIARLGDALRRLGESLRERGTLMELLQRQALYDHLTGLPNRTLFDDRLAAALAGRSPDRLLAVLLMDIDDFKGVNDTYGHETGDALLIAVGSRLQESVREGDTPARLGGDEFVVVLPDCADPTIPVAVAERVMRAMSEPFELGGHMLHMGVSLGVAIATAADRTTDDVVRNADVAMYLAKTAGKGRIEVFEPSMQADASIRLQLRTDLAAAIQAGDLRLHFQPVVDLRTDRTVGFEALVRWLRDGRLIAPGEFIPMAESTGLIGPLTDWVMDEACQTAAGWGGANTRPWVSINLSSSQLIRADLASRLHRTLDRTGLAPSRLILEITESSLLDIELARPAIGRLHALGLQVAIDDFGVGYSGLSYLAHLPIDIVKIDRSFVAALRQTGPDAAIASAIIALAQRLSLITIGEGIETLAQRDRLTSLGCDLGQGFYLGRPAAKPTLRIPERPEESRRPQVALEGATA